MNCYGQHGRSKDCKTCKLAKWCKDAGDPALKVDSGLPFHEIEYSEQVAQPSPLPPEPQAPGEIGNMSSVLSEYLWGLMEHPEKAGLAMDLLVDLRNLAKNHTKTFRVVALKILRPHYSYNDIAEELGLNSKQLVGYHMRRATGYLPVVMHALLIDVRFNIQKGASILTEAPQITDRDNFRGSLFRKRRKELKLKCIEVAGKVDISRRYLARIENNERKPSPEVFQRLRDVLGL